MLEKIMNREHSHPLWGLSVMLMAVLACVLPGQPAQPVSIPVSQPVNLETAVVGTAQAAEQQTEQANVLIATATRLSTDEPVRPEVISSTGTSLLELGDGSTQFRDHRTGVQIMFPSNWLTIRIGELEYYQASEKVGTQNSWFLEEIASLQSLDLNVFRLSAYDTHSEHILNSVLPKINVVFLQGDTRTLEQVEANEKQLIKDSVRRGHKFLDSDYRATAGGLQVLVFESQWSAGSYQTTYYQGTFFKVPAGLVVIDFYIPSELTEVMSPEHQQVVESITLFNP